MATKYIAPNGDGGVDGSGSSGSPYKLWATAVAALNAGDTLQVEDGTYTTANNGNIVIDSSGSANDGTAISPITIAATNERAALISGSGLSDTIRLLNLSYWHFHGLYAKSAENHSATGTNGDVIYMNACDHLEFKKLLLTTNNRWLNTHLMSIEFSNDCLVEDFEGYQYHRHCILNWRSERNTYRRIYGNSRGYADVSGGYASYTTDRGEATVSLYYGADCIVENVISENNGFGVDIQATTQAIDNKILGLISLNDRYGFIGVARGSGNLMPTNTIVENAVIINPTYYGIAFRSGKNSQLTNCSVFGGQIGVLSDQYSNPGDGVYTIYSENVCVQDATSYGFRMSNQADYQHDYCNGYNNTINFSASGSSGAGYTNTSTHSPAFGSVRCWVPEVSPLKGAGSGGADIGAEVIYAYEDGVLTSTKLWDATTGAWALGGAIVSGVNDVAGSSLSNVHERLGIDVAQLPYNAPNSAPVIGHNSTYPVTAWTLEDIALTVLDEDSNAKDLTLDGSTDGVSIEFGDATNCTVT